MWKGATGMIRIAGNYPQVQIVVLYMNMNGISQTTITLYDVPFIGDWNEDNGMVVVECLWSPRQLEDNIEDATKWAELVLVQDNDRHEQLIGERLSLYLKDEPWTWKI